MLHVRHYGQSVKHSERKTFIENAKMDCKIENAKMDCEVIYKK